jgi:hypothetical protein
LVSPVAEVLGAARHAPGATVVAVGRRRHPAGDVREPVSVVVFAGAVERPVAVGVDAIAELRGVGVPGGVHVVAVAIVGDPGAALAVDGRGCPTRRDEPARGIAEAVCVAIAVEEPHQKPFVGVSVAVIVQTVAGFRLAGPDRGLAVIAVATAAQLPGQREVAAARIDEPVAVGIRAPERRLVAVLVVTVVADLRVARVAIGVRVVAVVAPARDGGVAVAICIAAGIAIEDAAVALFIALADAGSSAWLAHAAHASLPTVAEGAVVAVAIAGAFAN